VRKNRTPGSARGRSGNWPSYRYGVEIKAVRKLILLALIASVVLLNGTSEAESGQKKLDRLTGPNTKEEACKALVSRVVDARLFPHIRKECFLCDLEDCDDYSFKFALRFNQEQCGGDSPSTLLDRFLIFQRSPVILWYDVAEDRYLPWEYAGSYRKGKN
jgi:hypothetical protein